MTWYQIELEKNGLWNEKGEKVGKTKFESKYVEQQNLNQHFRDEHNTLFFSDDMPDGRGKVTIKKSERNSFVLFQNEFYAKFKSCLFENRLEAIHIIGRCVVAETCDTEFLLDFDYNIDYIVLFVFLFCFVFEYIYTMCAH